MSHSKHLTAGFESKTERRFYISSAERSALDFFKLTRGHWGIENKLHWVLDVTFREDQCRVRSGKAAENFATLRHIALNLIKKDMNTKGSNRAKRKMAGWNDDYLLSLLRLF
jgi:predicted transposase YbfD/YdcC